MLLSFSSIKLLKINDYDGLLDCLLLLLIMFGASVSVNLLLLWLWLGEDWLLLLICTVDIIFPSLAYIIMWSRYTIDLYIVPSSLFIIDLCDYGMSAFTICFTYNFEQSYLTPSITTMPP